MGLLESFLRKGEVLAYVGRIHNLKDLKDRGRGLPRHAQDLRRRHDPVLPSETLIDTC